MKKAPVHRTGAFFMPFQGTICAHVRRGMRPASGARWEKRCRAVGGGCSGSAFSAAVGISSRPPRRRRNSGHRKAARSDNPEVGGSNPSPATTSGGCNGFQLHPPVFLLRYCFLLENVILFVCQQSSIGTDKKTNHLRSRMSSFGCGSTC